MTDVSQFPALEEATQILSPLDGHRQRQVLAFVFERYGWNLQPSAKKIAPAPTSPTNRSEFVAVEQLADLLDGVATGQHGPAIAFLAANYGAKVAAAYKPPPGGFGKKRKFTKG